MCHRWWLKGERAPGLAQQGYQWSYIFSAVRPATGEDFTLVLPVVSAAVMDLFLAQFAAALPADAHAVLVLDGAGWHDQRALTVPDNLTLVPLPAYSPELNPVERIWLYLRERFIFSLDDCAERPVEKPAGQHKVGELGRSVLANQPGFGKISRHAVK